MQETFDIGGDLTVNRLGFGAMRLCGDGIIGGPDDEASARAVVERALELGVDFIDTADSYGPGTSERLLREAGAPAKAVVATKAGLLREAGSDWLPHGDPDYIRNQALVSRDRLGVDTIDLYQFHRPDPDTDFAESVQAFAELKDEGFVRHVGLSNVTVDQLEQAREVVDVATVQNQYNVAHRPKADERVLDACEEYDIGFIPWYPLAAGDLDSVEGIDAIAERHDATPHQIALAWTLHRSDVMLPIPGTSSVNHLEANIAAGDIELGDEEMARLDAA
jgi:aryl-alcohol dehydrogenase-like predicted oxidoreductase